MAVIHSVERGQIAGGVHIERFGWFSMRFHDLVDRKTTDWQYLLCACFGIPVERERITSVVEFHA